MIRMMFGKYSTCAHKALFNRAPFNILLLGLVIRKKSHKSDNYYSTIGSQERLCRTIA